mmetsp:Transcript_1500/g.4508  ORF Transcript_1500/g.4508 Transcript_1500/m.4508 type:complete len:293 (+) Transcript_1500:95-973(+)
MLDREDLGAAEDDTVDDAGDREDAADNSADGDEELGEAGSVVVDLNDDGREVVVEPDADGGGRGGGECEVERDELLGKGVLVRGDGHEASVEESGDDLKEIVLLAGDARGVDDAVERSSGVGEDAVSEVKEVNFVRDVEMFSTLDGGDLMRVRGEREGNRGAREGAAVVGLVGDLDVEVRRDLAYGQLPVERARLRPIDILADPCHLRGRRFSELDAVQRLEVAPRRIHLEHQRLALQVGERHVHSHRQPIRQRPSIQPERLVAVVNANVRVRRRRQERLDLQHHQHHDQRD